MEMVVVMAMLGVFAAVAAPSFAQITQAQRLTGATEQVASALSFARAKATGERRCVRVRLLPAGNANSLSVERLNSYDCESASPGTPYIVTTEPEWDSIRSIPLDSDAVRLTLDPAAPFGRDELRFRPSGRLYGAVDADGRPNGGAVVKVTHTFMPAGMNAQSVVVESLGAICIGPRGVDIATDPPVCP